MEEQLRLLQEQFDEGYISQEVYNQRKQAIVNQQSNGLYGQLYPFGGQNPSNDYLSQLFNSGFLPQTGVDNQALGQNNMVMPTNGQQVMQPASTQTPFGSGASPIAQPLNRQPTPTVSNEDYSKMDLGSLKMKPSQESFNEYYNTLPINNRELEMPRQEGNANKNNLFDQMMPFFNPYGSNVQTDLYSLGSFLGTPKGTQGRGLGVASSAIALGLGAGRTLMSGYANSKATARAQEEAREKMAQRGFTQQMQYGNTNYLGGTM